MKQIKAIFLLYLHLILPFSSFSQSDLFKDYKLSNVGYISIPAIMEVQSGNYKELNRIYQKDIVKKFDYEVSDDKVVFQQKGLNEFKKIGFTSYARIIFETTVGSFGDYEKLNTNFSLSSSELKSLDEELKSQIKEGFEGSQLKLISWYGTSIVKINGRTALRVSYLRQLLDQPFVVVSIYRFYNNDRMHSLILSYRQEDAATWRSLFNKSLSSFTITNIR